MKSFNVDHKVIDKDIIRKAIVIVCKSKKKQERSKVDSSGEYKLPGHVIADLDSYTSKIDKYYLAQHILNNVDIYVDKVLEKILAFEAVKAAEYRGQAPREEDVGKAYIPKKCVPFFSRENANGKLRKITSVPLFPDQLIHQVLIQASQDVFLKYMYHYCCGSVPKKGIHKGKNYVEKTIRRHTKHNKSEIKYGGQFDVKQCYPSMPHKKLKEALRKKFRGMLFIWLVYAVIDSYHDTEKDGLCYGLPIGYSTSHWLCNFFLTPLDHAIKNDMGVKYFVRYMDDGVFFARSKKMLHKAMRAIMVILKRLGLRLKENWQVFRYDYMDRLDKRRGRAFDFLGFRFFRDKTILRKRNALTLRRAARRLGGMGTVPIKAARSFMSRMGQLRHSNSMNFYKRNIKPFVNIRKIKGVIRNASREHNQACQAV